MDMRPVARLRVRARWIVAQFTPTRQPPAPPRRLSPPPAARAAARQHHRPRLHEALPLCIARPGEGVELPPRCLATCATMCAAAPKPSRACRCGAPRTPSPAPAAARPRIRNRQILQPQLLPCRLKNHRSHDKKSQGKREQEEVGGIFQGKVQGARFRERVPVAPMMGALRSRTPRATVAIEPFVRPVT